ncbi:hypothetical protein D6764_04630 [Candidatus Woesearchaeota archaeon]|nr:MAG: hypothetical protein D6764_04630 [Candidatus Woesearchaeota archaeon]
MSYLKEPMYHSMFAEQNGEAPSYSRKAIGTLLPQKVPADRIWISPKLQREEKEELSSILAAKADGDGLVELLPVIELDLLQDEQYGNNLLLQGQKAYLGTEAYLPAENGIPKRVILTSTAAPQGISRTGGMYSLRDYKTVAEILRMESEALRKLTGRNEEHIYVVKLSQNSEEGQEEIDITGLVTKLLDELE